jgi:hypothetical protein
MTDSDVLDEAGSCSLNGFDSSVAGGGAASGGPSVAAGAASESVVVVVGSSAMFAEFPYIFNNTAPPEEPVPVLSRRYHEEGPSDELPGAGSPFRMTDSIPARG